MGIKVHKLVSGETPEKLNEIVGIHLQGGMWEKTEPTFFASGIFVANLTAEVADVVMPIDNREPGAIYQQAVAAIAKARTRWPDLVAKYNLDRLSRTSPFLSSGTLVAKAYTNQALRFEHEGNTFDIAAISRLLGLPSEKEELVIVQRAHQATHHLEDRRIYQL